MCSALADTNISAIRTMWAVSIAQLVEVAGSAVLGGVAEVVSLTPNQQSQTPALGLVLHLFRKINNIYSGTPTFLKKCPWDSYFENPSDNPVLSESIKQALFSNASHFWFGGVEPAFV